MTTLSPLLRYLLPTSSYRASSSFKLATQLTLNSKTTCIRFTSVLNNIHIQLHIKRKHGKLLPLQSRTNRPILRRSMQLHQPPHPSQYRTRPRSPHLPMGRRARTPPPPRTPPTPRRHTRRSHHHRNRNLYRNPLSIGIRPTVPIGLEGCYQKGFQAAAIV